MSPAANKPNAGSVLIVVLWVLGLLAMFVAAFAFDMHIEARISSTWRKRLKAEYLARAGVELARMALLETADPEINNSDPANYLAKGSDEQLRYAAIALAHGAGAELTRQLGEGSLSVAIQPENARLQVNGLIQVANRQASYEAWEPLLETAGVPREQWDSLVDCLLDWVDQDELSHLNGVESQYYESLNPPYRSKNAPLETLSELNLVKGFAEIIPDSGLTVFEALAPYLSMYAEDNKININAVGQAALMAALNIDAALAEQIIAERDGPDGQAGTADDRPFKDLNDLITRIPALTQALAERLSFSAAGRYAVQARGKVGDVERTISCVFKLDKQELLVLSWFEGSGAAGQLAD